MTPIIEVKGLTRAYGAFVAVDDISFWVEKGSLFAFLGPNGAGKSTTISVLTTLAPAQAGEVIYSIIDEDPRLVGQDDAAIRSRIGVVFQDSLLDRPLTVEANLRTRAGLYGRNGVDRIVDSLQLGDLLKRRYGRLSGGQRRRVDIARALLAAPEILFLDEPTTGLDPQSRNLVWETLNSLRESFGLTIFLTTHYMEEAERADQVTIIDHGKIIAEGTPAGLRAEHSYDRMKLRGGSELASALARRGLEARLVNDRFEVRVDDVAQTKAILGELGDLIIDFEVVHGTMDDVFLNLTGTSLRED
ncbi:MAG: ABC transporter ATP-binding protein [Propionibacteriaceae bacterium]|nr:ABC transporter ATP-binding protein [Propionibacteriaceae bacterium]